MRSVPRLHLLALMALIATAPMAPAAAQPAQSEGDQRGGNRDGGDKGPPPPTDIGQCPDTMSAFENSDEVVTCACPAPQMAAGAVWGSDTYTADSATCRAAQHAGVLSRRGGQVTLEVLPGQPRYLGTTRNGVQSANYGAYGTSYRFRRDAAPPPAPGTATPASIGQCPDTMTAFADSDEVVTCACPATQMAAGSVWGTGTYTADSATCRAALHAGALTRRGGEVTLEMRPGEARYPGTTRNGVQSSNYGAYASSYRFRGDPAPPTAGGSAAAAGAAGQCPDNMTAFADSDEALTCICPGETTLRGAVWGTDLYTADSATCRAAVHAGVIAATGGTVSLRMQPGQPRYPGTTRNGVQSSNYGAYGASYRFQGGQRTGPASAPVQAPVAETLRRTGQVQLYVTFRTGSADLDIGAAPVLAQVREALAADPALRLRLIGHTDSTGSAQVNQPLSGRRADAVRQWLVASGIGAERLAAEGRGPSEPIADNGSEAGRALNRRVQAARLD